MSDLSVGAVFAGHRIEGVAGRGGMGVVYRATHLALDRTVALKVIAPTLSDDESFRTRFKRESKLAASIRHPNVIPIHHAGEEEGLLFITMDYVAGSDLGALITAQGRLDPERAAGVIAEVASALDAAHELGLVHRDVKPANVLIDTHNGREHSYLTDFGLTKHMASKSGLTATATFVGTLDYTPPEQIEGRRLDARADVYALGCVLFQALSGEVPYPKDSDLAKIHAHLSEPPPSLSEHAPDVPPRLGEVIRQAMSKDPGERYPSAGDLGRAAVAAAAGQLPEEDERSVARGAAAPEGTVAAMGADPTAAAATGSTAAPAGDGPPDAPETAALGTPVPAGAPPRRPPSEPSHVYGRRGSRRLVVAASILAGVVILGAVLVATGLLAGGETGGDGGDAAAGSEVASIGIGGRPERVAVGAGSVWVTNSTDGTLARLDPETDEVAGEPFPLGGEPGTVGVGEGAVWATNVDEDTLIPIDPETGQAAAEPIRLGGSAKNLAVGEGAVWVRSRDRQSVLRIDPASNQLAAEIPLGGGGGSAGGARGIAVGEGAVWVKQDDGAVARIDPETNDQAADPIPAGGASGMIAVGAGSVWVTDAAEGTLLQIDPGSNEVVGEPIELDGGAVGVAVGSGAVWVANPAAGTISRVDPGAGEITGEPVAVGSEPLDLAVGEGAVWVANSGDETVSRVAP